MLIVLSNGIFISLPFYSGLSVPLSFVSNLRTCGTESILPFPEHGILHFRGRSADWMMAVHHRQAVKSGKAPRGGKQGERKRGRGGGGEATILATARGKCGFWGERRPARRGWGGSLDLGGFVRHLLAENHFLPSHISVVLMFKFFILNSSFLILHSVVVLCFLFDVLVQQRAPVHDEQPVRVVLRPGYPLELSGVTSSRIRILLRRSMRCRP